MTVTRIAKRALPVGRCRNCCEEQERDDQEEKTVGGMGVEVWEKHIDLLWVHHRSMSYFLWDCHRKLR